MKNFFSLLFSVLVNPSKVTRKAIARKPFFSGLFILLLALSSSMIAGYLQRPQPANLMVLSLIGNLLIKVVATALILFSFSAFFHISADVLGGGGSGAALVSLLFVGTAPAILLTPAALLCRTMPALSQPLVVMAIQLVVVFWIFLLYLAFIREIYRFNLAKAFAVMALPVVVGTLLIIALGLDLSLSAPIFPLG